VDLRSLIARGASMLKASGVLIGHNQDNALDEARELVLHALHLPEAFPAHLASAQLLQQETELALALLNRRIKERIPAAYLTGKVRFAGHVFKTDQRALIPRSPIAELIQQGFTSWFRDHQPMEILDLCTGSGCIGIAAAKRFPSAHVMLADLSLDAISLAEENIDLHAVGLRVRAIQSDLFDSIHGRFDLILSNPPYVTDDEYAGMAKEYHFEPKLGLTSGAEGLDHPIQILQQAARYLTDGGLLVLEVGEAERALRRKFPSLGGVWVEFSVGQMGVLAIGKDELIQTFGH
jgi:ribosomal protein L3 glutamine methyltransferase